uniref:Sec-independent protein translocase component TatC n=1 Tax=Hypnea musciformis TaxID=31429 RepID=UPI00300137CD|nr:Sec-independent protein translocase component TatC [Hypnea musciformis]
MVCCVFCSFVIFKNLSLVIFIESFFFTTLGFRKFILINITDLVDLLWYICFQNALFSSSLYFGYSIFQFCNPGWYHYQNFIQVLLYKNGLKLWLLVLGIFYFYFLPLILTFLTQWKIHHWTDSFYVKFELNLFHYVIWVLYLKFYFVFIFYFIVLFLFQSYILVELKILYKMLKKNKKQIFYIILCLLFLMSPPDGFFQIFLLIITILLIEMMYFFMCFIITNTNIYSYAYGTTITKKIKKKKIKKKKINSLASIPST